MEISTEPAVREHVRSLYLERAVVSTRPTSDGNDAIDAFHQYAAVKWLLDKPISAFNDAQWLSIEKATEEKLLEVTVSLPKQQISSLMQDCEALYLSDGVSLTAQQWNEQRKQILHDAIVSLLLPAMEKEARMLLATRAKQWLSSQCGLELWKKVSVAPYVPVKSNDQDERYVSTLKFLQSCTIYFFGSLLLIHAPTFNPHPIFTILSKYKFLLYSDHVVILFFISEKLSFLSS